MDAYTTRPEEDVAVIWPSRLLGYLAVVYAFQERNGATHDPIEEGISVAACSVGVRGLCRDHLELAPDGGLPHWEDMLEELHKDSATLLVSSEANTRDTHAVFRLL